ncbi:polysaccharide biosynthesis/export family protein [Pontibacter sp. MBLB2868]|uniref:polysaccharide biosynthesis/export family protein n=1 Tax=Pontibacter sp. MBLB2868 TaxID=3451555 RepID=UPI003F752140
MVISYHVVIGRQEENKQQKRAEQESTTPMRKTLIAFQILFLITVFSSCVPQKKLMLLQNESTVKDQGRADELVKTFDLNRTVYTLRPGDVISLQVQSTTQTEYNFLTASTSEGAGVNPKEKGYKLDADGNILLPTIGQVNLSGLSMAEARQKLKNVIKPYLADPNVFVSLLNFRFTILGEVGSQGQIIAEQENLNVVEAIALAGGFSPYSNRGKIRLMRYEGDKAKLYTFSMLDDDIITSKNFYLQPNDMIVVDPLPAKYFKESIIPSLSLGISVLTALTLIALRLAN